MNRTLSKKRAADRSVAAAVPSRKRAAERGSEAISSRQDGVRERVLLMIQNGQLRPGDRINEVALAGGIGVGRNVAREALRALEKSGMVRIVPNRGAYVCQLSLEDVLDLYDIRAGLARTCGRLVAGRHTDEDLRVLDQFISKMEECAAHRDAQAYAALNRDFHRTLTQATKNPRLIEISLAIEDQLRFLLRKGTFSASQMNYSHGEHRDILDALRNGNRERAAKLLEAHVLLGKQRMLDTMIAHGRDTGREYGGSAAGANRSP